MENKTIDKYSKCRINLYIPEQMIDKYKKLNSELKEQGSCVSNLFQELVMQECNSRGIR